MLQHNPCLEPDVHLKIPPPSEISTVAPALLQFPHLQRCVFVEPDEEVNVTEEGGLGGGAVEAGGEDVHHVLREAWLLLFSCYLDTVY